MWFQTASNDYVNVQTAAQSAIKSLVGGFDADLII